MEAEGDEDIHGERRRIAVITGANGYVFQFRTGLFNMKCPRIENRATIT